MRCQQCALRFAYQSICPLLGGGKRSFLSSSQLLSVLWFLDGSILDPGGVKYHTRHADLLNDSHRWYTDRIFNISHRRRP